MANDIGCKSFYDEARCRNKCNSNNCPGASSGKCLSNTALGQPAPPLSLVTTSNNDSAGSAAVSLPSRTTVKGAYL